jgi:polyisoprenoid-binding protein YceI
MKRNPMFVTLFATAIAVASPVFAAPTTYTLDPDHTDVVFTWNHFGFSNPSAHFGRVDSSLVYDSAHPENSSVTATIPLAGLETHVPKLNTHLASTDFFDAAKYPSITFKSTKVTVAGKDTLQVRGDLTVHGVTRPVLLDVTINKVGEHPIRKMAAAGFDATTTLKRSDFGVAAYVPNVSDEIKVHISTEAVDAKAFAAMKAKAPGN